MKNILKIMIISIFIIFLIQYSFAKYVDKVEGQANAKIAEMKFTINEKSYKSMEEIEFASTITKQNPKVTSGILAPGTAGYIPIVIDATETETSLEYEINIDLVNKPTNLKFYSDETRIEEIPVEDDNIVRRGYIELNSNNNEKIKYENIYWSWEEETGKTRNQIFNNDIEDSRFMDKIMMMNIKVKGTQKQTAPVYLKDTINVGDKIKYKISNDNTIYGIVVNKTVNQIELMPINPETGKAETVGDYKFGLPDASISEVIESYNDITINLDNEAKKYSKAIRALTVEDINRLTGFIPSESNISGIQKTYTSGIFIIDELTRIVTEDNEEMNAIDLPDIKVGDTITIGNTYGGKKILEITMKCTLGENSNALYYYKSSDKKVSDFLDKTCFLASRCVSFFKVGYCEYRIRYYYSVEENINNHVIYSSDGTVTTSNSLPVVPVISLSSTTHTKQITNENNNDEIIWEVIK